MNKARNDPKTGAQKVTNTDEQEVAVNHSTVQEGGYDEPTNKQEEEQPAEKLPKKEEETVVEQSRPRPGKPQPGAVRRRPYDEEEAE